MLARMMAYLEQATNRRSFIGRFASACSALGLSMFGMGQLAVAGGGPGCCSLCLGKPTCAANPTCTAKWCWVCHSGTGQFCTLFQCLECLDINACSQFPCREGGTFCDACANVTCNHSINTSQPCF
jgi:hypothetical protein